AVAGHPCLCPSRVVCITPRKAQACFLGKVTQNSVALSEKSQKHGDAIGTAALKAGISAIRSDAIKNGAEKRVYVRVGEDDDGNIYLDLGDRTWDAVKITKDGWDFCSEPACKFRRPDGMLALPRPVKEGVDFSELRRFLNVGSDRQWTLTAGWLLASLNPRGPYPTLSVFGEHGSAKTFFTQQIRSVLDPHEADVLDAMESKRDLAVASHNMWIVALDDLPAKIEPWLYKAICRLATGRSYVSRKLFKNRDLSILKAKQPVIVNGIAMHGLRSDYMQRTYKLELPIILTENRITERSILAQLREAHPRILGGLLNAAVLSLRNVDSVLLTKKPRMADAAEWIVAGETGLGLKAGSFEVALAENEDDIEESLIDSSEIAKAVMDLGSWNGSPTEFYEMLKAKLEFKVPDFPASAAALTAELAELAPRLRSRGVDFSTGKSNGQRTIKVRRVATQGRTEGQQG